LFFMNAPRLKSIDQCNPRNNEACTGDAPEVQGMDLVPDHSVMVQHTDEVRFDSVMLQK